MTLSNLTMQLSSIVLVCESWPDEGSGLVGLESVLG